MKELKHISYVEGLSALGHFSMEKMRVRRISSKSMNTWREGATTMEPGSFLWFSVTRQEGTRTKWNTRGTIWITWSTSLLWQSAGSVRAQRGCGVSLEIFRSHPDRGLSSLLQMALLEHGFRQDNLQQTLPISIILGFSEHTQWVCRKREDDKLKEALKIFPRAMVSSCWIRDLFYAGLLHPLSFTQAVLLAVCSALKENCCLISSYKILYSHHVR